MLEARSLRKTFGGVPAVNEVSLFVRRGEVVGMVGPNGSGKSTLLDLLCGRIRPDRGTVLVDGKAQAQGLQNGWRQPVPVFRTHQVPRLFPAHTVAENVMLGEWGIPEGVRATDHTSALGAFSGAERAGSLSVGERRRLILTWLWQRLNVTGYYLLDEPCAGGDEEYVSDLVEFTRTARAKGKGILWVEHNYQVLRSHADRILTMLAGRCEDRDASSLPMIQQQPVPGPSVPESAAGLFGKGLTIARGGALVVKGVSIDVRPGEVVGLLGPNGSGKTTVLLALYGDPQCTLVQGAVLDGVEGLPTRSPSARIARGIHLLPQEGGIFKSLTVQDLITASLEASCQDPAGFSRLPCIVKRVPHLQRIWKRLGGTLSGGERRLTGIARILALSPRFALLDEPSAGLDQSSRTFLAGLIADLASQGAGVIVAEQDVSFARSTCTRFVELGYPAQRL